MIIPIVLAGIMILVGFVFWILFFASAAWLQFFGITPRSTLPPVRNVLKARPLYSFKVKKRVPIESKIENPVKTGIKRYYLVTAKDKQEISEKEYRKWKKEFPSMKLVEE